MLPRIAVVAAPFPRPWRAVFHAAASIGAQGVVLDSRSDLKPNELSDTGRRQFLHELGEFGLSIAALHFPTRRALFDQEELEARIAACRLAMQFAWQLRARVVTVRVGRIPTDAASKEHLLLREVLTDLASYGNQVGVTLALTPMRDAAETLASLLSGVTSGPLGVNFDPMPFVVSGQRVDQAFRALHDRIAQVTVRDALRDVDGLGVETAVGRGEVPWDELLALSQEAGYQGWWAVDRTQGDDPAGDIARAVTYLRNVALGG